jgi:putative membrane protein
MGWHWADGGWWMMGLTMVVWVLLLVLLVALIVWLVSRASRGPDRGVDSAEEVLRRRFAAGDIDAEEYERRLSALRR